MSRLSPAQQHYQRTVAAMAAAAAGQGDAVQGDDYKMMEVIDCGYCSGVSCKREFYGGILSIFNEWYCKWFCI